jgi:hypothetical protein
MGLAIVLRCSSPTDTGSGLKNYVSCVGLRLICTMVVFTSIAPRVGSRVYIHSTDQSFAHCDRCEAPGPTSS